MNIKWLTNKLIKEINDFLSKKNKKLKFESKLFRSDKFDVDKNYFGEEGERDLLEGDFFKIKRDIVRMALLKFPVLDDNYNKNRDFDLSKFIVYNANACYFNDFRIDNFNTFMNDKEELKWFDKYIGIKASKAPNWRTSGRMLVKCTTTTYENLKYMVGNYTMERVNYCYPGKYLPNIAIYDGENVIKKFDSLNSSNLKAIRGFVRYDDIGKHEVVVFLKKLLKTYGSSLDFVIFIYSLTSIFIKGGCMSIESEYRFLILSKTSNLKSISLDIKPKHCNLTKKVSNPKKYINKYYKCCNCLKTAKCLC